MEQSRQACRSVVCNSSMRAHSHDPEKQPSIPNHCRRTQILPLAFAHQRLGTSHGQYGEEGAGPTQFSAFGSMVLWK